jgi:23S rRNA (guanosine2251-2'-O)-methyltransferase
VTKDRPRNQPGNGGKQGRFRGPGGQRDWKRGPAPKEGRGGNREQGESGRDSDAVTGDEKPWSREGRPGKPSGESRNRHPDGDRARGRQGGQPPQLNERREASFEEHGEAWIWGLHAAGAALANPMRRISKAYVSPNAAQRVGLDPAALPAFAQLMEPRDMDERLPPGAVHQGLAVRCKPLDGIDISEAAMRPDQALAILDQVTDPQNVGAIFRSAAAFGVGGVVMQTRNAPALGGALAKAAVGAIETVEEIRAVNISRAIDALTDAGWKVIGLAGEAKLTLDEAVGGWGGVAVVVGAEGAGLRQSVAKACSVLARIPMQPGMESLNVSNAAAIAFYEIMRARGTVPPPAPKSAPAADADDGGFGGEDD